MDHDVALLRRYVLRRARGAYPCPEYAFCIPIEGVGSAWLRCDEKAARASDRWRRVRLPGRPWCPVLGNHVAIAQDVELQSFFTTIADDGWSRLEHEARRRPRHCLPQWRATGVRLILAAQAAAAGYCVAGKLSGWPSKRGSGVRSLVLEW